MKTDLGSVVIAFIFVVVIGLMVWWTAAETAEFKVAEDRCQAAGYDGVRGSGFGNDHVCFSLSDAARVARGLT